MFRIGYADGNVTDFPHSCEKADTDWVPTFVLCTVADILNLKPVFVSSPSRDYGKCPLEAGKCTGLFGMLQNGEIDSIKGAFSYTRGGINVLHTTPVNTIAHYAVFTDAVITKSDATAGVNVGLPLEVFSVFALMYFGLVVIKVIKDHRIVGLSEVFWKTFSSIIGQNSSTSTMTIITAFVISVLLDAAFRTQVLNGLKPKFPFRTKTELVNLIENSKFKPVFYSKSSLTFDRLFPNPGHTFVQNPPKFIANKDVDPVDLCENSFYIMFGILGEFSKLPCSISAFPTEVHMASVVFSKHSQDIFEKSNEIIDRLFNVDSVESNLRPKLGFFQDRLSYGPSVQPPKAMSVKSFKVPLLTFGVAMFMCCFVFLVEFVWGCLQFLLHNAIK